MEKRERCRYLSIRRTNRKGTCAVWGGGEWRKNLSVSFVPLAERGWNRNSLVWRTTVTYAVIRHGVFALHLFSLWLHDERMFTLRNVAEWVKLWQWFNVRCVGVFLRYLYTCTYDVWSLMVEVKTRRGVFGIYEYGVCKIITIANDRNECVFCRLCAKFFYGFYGGFLGEGFFLWFYEMIYFFFTVLLVCPLCCGSCISASVRVLVVIFSSSPPFYTSIFWLFYCVFFHSSSLIFIRFSFYCATECLICVFISSPPPPFLVLFISWSFLDFCILF